MTYGNAAKDESSVVVPLRGPMGLEEERQRQEQERMLAFQLEIRRISARRHGIPAWTIGATAVVFLVLLGVGIAFHLSVTADYQRRIDDLQARMESSETRSAAQLGRAEAALGKATARAVYAERTVNELRGKLARIEDEVDRLEVGGTGKRTREVREGGQHTRPRPGAQAAAGGGRLSDDPLDDGLQLD